MAMSFLGRTLITKSNTNVLPSILSRSFAAKSFSSSSSPLLHLRSIVALAELRRVPSIPFTAGLRCYSTRQTTSSLNDPSPNWNNRPPKETILLEGCDFEHWLIVTEKPEGDPTRDEIIDGYIKLVASVVGSEEEARKQIYSVSTRHYYAIGVIVPEELSFKFKEIPNVRWVLPDSYLDVRNKDYGGEPFVDGQAVPYDPKYHEEWVRNNARANERSRRNDRPRNFDRSRNFERRRENMQNRDFQAPTGNQGPPGPNMGGGPPGPNMGGMPPNANHQNAVPMAGGMPPNANMQQNHGGMPPNANMQQNHGGMPPNAHMQQNHGGIPPNANVQNSYRPNPPNMQNSGPQYGPNNGPNYGPGPNAGYSNNYGGGMPPRDAGPNAGYTNNMNIGGGPNAGYPNSVPPNAGHMPNGQYSAPNNGGMPPYQQNREGPPSPNYQNNYAPPNRNAGGVPSGNAYQVRDLPGRDY